MYPAKGLPKLEFQTYAVEVAKHLVDYGWLPVRVGQESDYKVGLHFWMGGSRENVSGSFSSGTGYVGSSTEHDRFLVMVILDKNNNTVFEGRVRSAGSRSDIAAVMPQMIDSLFASFPGKSGKSTRMIR